MLTLAESFRAGSCTIYRDVVYRGGQRVHTPVFYALPDAPSLARDAAGSPAFDFLWYRSLGGDDGGAAQAGGLVTLSAELGVDPDVREAALATIRERLGRDAPDAIDLVALPFKRGTVTLTFAGDGSANALARVAGSGPARLSGSQRATFVVELTRDGAALLWQALEHQQELFHLQYDLVCDVRLDEVRLRVWCDAEQAHEIARRVTTGEALTAERLRETLTQARAAGVELSYAQTLAPEHVRDLEELGRSVLEQALASTLFAFDADGADEARERLIGPDGRVGALRPYGSSLAASLNFTLSEAYPVERHFVLADVLRLGMGPGELGDRVRQITLDGGFFKILEVKVLCTANFDTGPIDKVKVSIKYHHRAPSGAAVHRTGEFILQSGSETATFRTDLAAPHLTSYSYRAEVYFHGDAEPYRIARDGVEGNVVVLDLDDLGVLRVAVGLRDVPFDLMRGAIVDIEYPARNLAWRAILNGELPAATWEAVVRERAGPYRYRVAWLTADERRLEEGWQQSRRGTLWLDAPPELRRRANVLVVAGGSFDGVRQILVSLSLPDGTSPVDVTFSEPGQSATWEPPVANPETFRYHATTAILYADGTRRTIGPVEEDRPVLVARDLLSFEVKVIARRLDLGGRWSMALLAFERQDEGASRTERKTLVLRHPGDAPTWRIRVPEAERPHYRYQLTLIGAQGERLTGPWREAAEEILVLEPPVLTAPQEA